MDRRVQLSASGCVSGRVMALGEQGYTCDRDHPRPYYGESMYINSSEEVSGVPASYPGFPLSLGSSGSDVMKIQEQLNRISDNYPLIPKLVPDGIVWPADTGSRKSFPVCFRPDSGRGRRKPHLVPDPGHLCCCHPYCRRHLNQKQHRYKYFFINLGFFSRSICKLCDRIHSYRCGIPKIPIEGHNTKGGI